MEVTNGGIKLQLDHRIAWLFVPLDTFGSEAWWTENGLSFWLMACAVEFWFPLWVCAKELSREPWFHTMQTSSWKWTSSHDDELTPRYAARGICFCVLPQCFPLQENRGAFR